MVYQPTQSELHSFCEGMIEMYEYGEEISPDLLVFPLRGAFPFYVCYRTIAEIKKQEMPRTILPPLGLCWDNHKYKKRGLTIPEKKRVVDDYIVNMEDLSVLLVDEVMNGGTIITHRWLLNQVTDIETKVCAIEHGKHEPSGSYENKSDLHGFKRIQVESLFVMDRPQYLPEVTKNDGFRINAQENKLNKITETLSRMVKPW